MTEHKELENVAIADLSDICLKLTAAHRHFFNYRDNEISQEQKVKALSAILALWKDLDGTCYEMETEINNFLDFEITPQDSII